MNKEIVWKANLEEAARLAKEENKALLIDFSNPG